MIKVTPNMIKYNNNSLFHGEKMAKPRIFVSSTYYDLKYIRNNLEQFINSFGYEAVLFESGDITFTPNQSLESSCYQEINSANMLILIIGGKFGTKSEESKEEEKAKQTKDLNSITMKEYLAAHEKNIPIFVFVDSQVMSEFETYKKNKDKDFKIEYAHANHENIFKLIADIHSKRTSGMFTKTFDKFDDIALWLKEQWAGMFTEYLKQLKESSENKRMASKINDLDAMINRLTTYNSAILKQLVPSDYEKIVKDADDTEKMEKFFSSDLGEWLYNKSISFYEKCNNTEITSDKLFHLKREIFKQFIRSKDAEDFLELIQIDENDKTDILNKFRVELQNDYEIEKALFNTSEAEVGNIRFVNKNLRKKKNNI